MRKSGKPTGHCRIQQIHITIYPVLCPRTHVLGAMALPLLCNNSTESFAYAQSGSQATEGAKIEERYSKRLIRNTLDN